MKTTRANKKYWKNRKIDWKKAYLSTWDHPHRTLLAFILQRTRWGSLFEIGCGAGANIAKIIQTMPGRQMGGMDINEDAIKTAKEAFVGGRFYVGSADNIPMNGKSVDIILSDMCLIYVGPRQIKKYLREIKRVARHKVVLCEFHTNSWWKKMFSKFGRYNVYNYRKLLREVGFYDIVVTPIPPNFWSGTDKNTEFRSIIVARV